jgi:hypothetical protein
VESQKGLIQKGFVTEKQSEANLRRKESVKDLSPAETPKKGRGGRRAPARMRGAPTGNLSDSFTLCQNLKLYLHQARSLQMFLPEKVLGAGAFGVTIRVMDTTRQEPSVLKLIRWDKEEGRSWSRHMADAQKECKIQTAFAKLGLTIPMRQKTCRPQQVTIAGQRFAVLQMDFISETLAQWLRARRTHAELTTMLQSVMLLITKMGQNKLTHGDMHLDNIGVVIGATPGSVKETRGKQGKGKNQANGMAAGPLASKIVLIDFGQAHVGGQAHPLLDFLCVFRGTLLELNEVFPDEMNKVSAAKKKQWWQSEVVDLQAKIARRGKVCLENQVAAQTDEECPTKIADMYQLRNLTWMKQVLYKWFVQQWPKEARLVGPLTNIEFGSRLNILHHRLWREYMRNFVDRA